MELGHDRIHRLRELHGCSEYLFRPVAAKVRALRLLLLTLPSTADSSRRH